MSRRPTAVAAAAASAFLLLAACSSGGGASAGDAAGTQSTPSSGPSEASEDESATAGAPTGCEVVPDGTFPVEIEHALGTTTIEAQPERIATVAWANHEVPLALGVVPVGMASVSWGDDDGNGIMPWVEDKLAELNADTPVLFDETDGIDFEKVASTNPDVILASYSGLSEEDYKTLSKIAPVVAYPDTPWGTSMWDMICLNAAAIGKSSSAAELTADLQEQTQAALEANPELKDKKIVFAFIDPSDLSQIGFYTLHDTRPGFLAEVGLAQPQLVVDATGKTGEFYTTISSEQADQFADADVIVTYGDSQQEVLEMFQSDPLLATIPAVKAGNVVVLKNNTPLAASANPSPLSIPWGIGDYFTLLNSTK